MQAALAVGWALLLAASASHAQNPLGDALQGSNAGLDASHWLLKENGVLPVPILITEPAVGYGAGVGLLHFREPSPAAKEKARAGAATPPDVYGIGAFATENGSWGAALGGMVSFRDDRWRWRGGVARTSLDLDFYGEGGGLEPIAYNLDGWVSVQQAMVRLGAHDAWLVARWNYLSLESRFDREADASRAGRIDRSDTVSGLGLSLEYDSRDNIFTPNRGWTGSIDLTFHDPDWGSDTRFQSYRAHVFAYWPLARDLVLGGRADLRSAEGRVPFYMLPFVDLRGIPALRLQDTHAGVLEAELRWTFQPKWGLVAFLGGGRAWGRSGDFSEGTGTVSKGAGVRYQIAAQLGLWVGVDLAWSTQDRAFYIQVGNAWR